MIEKFPSLEKFDHLSQDELQLRLAQEAAALSSSSDSEQLSLLHELRLYQLELELQNRELRKTHIALEIARDKYVSLYDFAPVAFLTLDRNAEIREINKTGSGWLANTAPRDLINQSLINYISANDKPVFSDFMKKIQSSVHKILQHDFMMVRTDDTPVYARMYCIQRVDIATSEMLCYMAILDLTELRIAEREAQQSVRALAHSTRLAKLGEMASALAHEVSQPITALLNYVHILEKKLNTGADIEELKMITEKIAAQANRSSVLSHQIRDYSRLQKSVKSRQSITNIIKESVDLMHANLFEHKVELNLQIQDKLPHVSVDAQQIIQVFVNMISNAIDSIGLTNRYGLIVIRAEMIEKPMRIKISIKDNGAGVSESVKKKLFMPFTSNKEDGLGIGLSLSRSIIEAHGGQVWLDKDYSDGANFYFTLPVGE